ncbi:ankyrin repeat and LEM domain-containing protein 1 isoform X2 [Apteryx mantelli]|uniref:Ankyrin repeat and LEM domain-containing protein 1 isoform X2 n=1 Tax=Apteryx mantelli TaxID=2696672 RepID=A0ABM4FV08_9AVES
MHCPGGATGCTGVSLHPLGSRFPMQPLFRVPPAFLPQQGDVWACPWQVEAVCGGQPWLVEALLEQGADPNLVLPEGVAAIHLAAGMEREGGVRCLGLILRHGGDPNARSAEALTPLHVAASWGCHRCLELLLRTGGDPELRDQDGKRAVDLALEQGNRVCAQVLRDWQHAARRPLPGKGVPSPPRCTGLRLRSRHGTAAITAWSPACPRLPVPRVVPFSAAWGGGWGQLAIPAVPAFGVLMQPCSRLARTRRWLHEAKRSVPGLCLADAPEDLRGPRRSLSFLTEDRTEASVPSRLSEDGFDPGPLSSTRKWRPSSGRGSGEPPAATASVSVPSVAGWPGAAPGGSALAPRPLACSTLLCSPRRPPAPQPRSPGTGGSPGDGGSDDDELFVSAAETLEPPEAGGSPGARCPPSPHRPPSGSAEPSGAAALPALLQACSLGGSSPPGPEPPRLCHVTPRTKSRLEASAARFSAAASSSSSSSSSLFSETLQMPRRPPRRRGPAVPPRHHVTLRDGDASDLEGTGSSDATVLLSGQPGLSQGAGGSPGSSPTVLLGSGERGRPVDTDEPPQPLSDATLLRELRRLGADPGPVTALTRRVYVQRLAALSEEAAAGHSPELAAALETCRIPDCADDELALARQFDCPNGGRRWRGGTLKSSFNYLLLDPRATQDLPLRSHLLSPAERFRTFVQAIFYVGKGTRARPYCHLYEALSHYRAGKAKACPKVRRILEIWASGQGVLSVHCFQSAVPAEAFTREACLVEAIGLRMLTNQKKGNCYGVAAAWPAPRRRRLGVHMLHRAMRIFLAEGERQLRPADIQAGR